MYSFTIIGADEDYTSSEAPTITQLSALTGYTTASFSVLGIYARFVFEADEKTAACGYKSNTLSKYKEYTVEFDLNNLPTTVTSLESLNPELSAIEKPYLWIYSSDYTLDFVTADQTRAVYVSGTPAENRQTNSLFGYRITFRTRKPS